MAKKLIILLASVVLLSPVSVLAHAGHEHGEAKPKLKKVVVESAETSPAPSQAQADLMRENSQLREDVEQERLNAAKRVAEIVTDMSSTRSSYIIIGLLLGAIGLVIRYLPGKEEK
jgi:hypothetical protein